MSGGAGRYDCGSEGALFLAVISYAAARLMCSVGAPQGKEGACNWWVVRRAAMRSALGSVCCGAGTRMKLEA